MPQLPAAAEGPQYKELGPPFKMNEDDALSNLTENEYPLLQNFVEHQKSLWPVIGIGGTQISGLNTLVSQFTLPDAAQVNILFSSASKMYYADVALPGATTLTEITCATTPITAITNAAAAVMTIGATPLPTTFNVTITGFTGAWVTANGARTATRTGATTFSIPVDSTAFGASAGTPVVAIEPILADAAGSNLYSVAYVNGALYFAHDGTGPLRVWGGSTTYTWVAAPVSGYHANVFYKPYYLGAQNNRLIILGDAAASVGTQYDVIGSTTTNAADFVSFGAFYTQLLDTTDKISGGSVLYGKLIIYKKDSIIIATPSGDASAPYNFERYQQSTEQAVGLFASYSLVNDGGFRDIFMSRYGMVMFDGSNFQMIGAGVDNALMGSVQLGGSLTTTPTQATLGTIYTQGTAYPTGTAPIPATNGTNKPERFYLIIGAPGAGLNGAGYYLFNVDKGGWSKIQTLTPIFGVGAMFVANTDSQAASAPTAQKCLVVGNALLNMPTLAVSSVANITLFKSPSLQIGSGPAIYGSGPHLQKTVARIGIGFQFPVGVTTTAFSVTATVLISGSNASAGGMVPSTASYSAQVAIPVIATTTNVEQFAWIDIDSTCRSPVVQINFPSDQTARYWPRITRLVVQFTLGGDS